MTDNAQRTLFHPFETGDVPLPSKDERGLFIGAELDFILPDGFAARLSLVQGFRPHFRALKTQGFDVSPRALGDGYDLALVLLGRHRGENEAWLAEAVARVRKGGLVVAAGTKKNGADSARKRMGEILLLLGHLAKFHGTVFWFERPSGEKRASLVAEDQPLVDGRFHTVPGMFSHDRVDAASRLLADNLPDDVKGAAADFGAGWGFLAAELVERSPSLTTLDIYEADFESLEAAKRNLENLPRSAELEYLWHDLLTEPVERRYDFIVMNPPFHQGRAADPGLGHGMIRAAAAALKPGGRLMMVANRGLPYEAALQTSLKAHGEVCRDDKFKVLWGRR